MSETRSSTWKWWVTGLLLLATTINYMDRQTLSLTGKLIRDEFGLSSAKFGVSEWVFGWSFAAGSVVFGFLADRLRIYWLYPFVLFGWSLMGLISGYSRDFNELLVCRGLLGFFEAGHWPCALKTTFAILNAKERTMGNSVLQSGASIGAMVTGPLVLWLTALDGGSWRLAFIAVGCVGILWLVPWFLSIKKSDLQELSRLPTEPKTLLWPHLLSKRFWALALLILGTQICWHVFRVWLPMFMEEGRGYSREETAWYNALYFAFTDVGCFCAGFLSLWLIQKRGHTPHSARRWVYGISCVLTSTSLLVGSLGKGPMLIVVLLIVGMGALALFPCYYSYVQELSTSHVGRLTGVLSAWVWLVSSPIHWVFGAIKDKTGSYDTGLMICGLAPWIGVIAMKLLWTKDPTVPSTDSSPSHAH